MYLMEGIVSLLCGRLIAIKKLAGLLILLGTWLFVTTRRNTLSQRAQSKPTIRSPIHLKPQVWYYVPRYLGFWSQKWTRGGELGRIS